MTLKTFIKYNVMKKKKRIVTEDYFCNKLRNNEQYKLISKIKELKVDVSKLNLNWNFISLNDNLTIPFISYFKDYINFHDLSLNKNLTSKHLNKFNKLFELHKISDADDRGYQSKRSNKRLDYDEIQRRNENKKQEKLEIQVYEEPEPIELTTDNYKRLGVKYVKDFSQNVGKQGSNYCDFQKAYTEFDTQNMTNHREKNYKSVDDYKRQRANQNFSISPEQALKIKVKKKQELAMEEKRRFYVSKKDKKIEKKFKSFQNYIQM